MKRIVLGLVLSAGLFLSLPVNAQTLPTGFSFVNVSSGWTNPTGGAFNRNGKELYVWEKAGKVWLCNWNNSTSQYEKQATPVLDISEEVGDWRDYGLLGFALDPNFDHNGLIYLFYVVDRHYLMNFGKPTYNAGSNEYFNATIGRITRYKTITDGSNIVSADLSSRFVLLGETKKTGVPILHQSHGTGTLAFADDGTLIASTGDGASYSSNDGGSANESYYRQGLTDSIIRPEENVGAFRSQMLNSLNGKLLRIDPQTGNGIPSNPFYSASEPRAPHSRVWALGFRNPFRFSIKPNSGSSKPATGDIGEIFVGDVGNNTWEEMDVVTEKGANFGWPLFEGQTGQPGYDTLKIENKDEPNPLFGNGGCTQHFFLFKQLLKQATADGDRTVYNPCDPSEPITGGNTNRFFHNRPVLDWWHNGAGTRVGIFNGNVAATADIGTPASGVVGTTYAGNCSIGGTWYDGTMFPPDYRNTYLYSDYGRKFIKRATMQTSTTIERIDNIGSNFSAIVFLTQNPRDGSVLIVDMGSAPNQVKLIAYGGSQPPVVVMSADKIFGPSDLTVNFAGATSFDPEGSPLTYAWNFGDGHTSTVANPVNTFTGTPGVPKKYVVKLTVKDNLNLSTTDSMVISVNNTPPVVNITSPVKDSYYQVGSDTLYSLEATVTDAEQTNGQLKYEWQSILRHNNHQHAEEIDTVRSTSTLISRLGCNGDAYYWLIMLTVTDDAGLSTADSAKIFPFCSSDVGLPIKLTSFTVQTRDGSNLAKWTSDTEMNARYYQLERSTDGVHFIKIAELDSRNSSLPESYSYADSKFAMGSNFYRLKLVDMDGSFTYSKIVKVYNGALTDYTLKVIPNPVQKEFTLSTSFPDKGAVQIRISDITGKVVRQLTEQVSKGYQTLTINQLETLAAGTYYIEVKQKDYSRNAKFVKVE